MRPFALPGACVAALVLAAPTRAQRADDFFGLARVHQVFVTQASSAAEVALRIDDRRYTVGLGAPLAPGLRPPLRFDIDATVPGQTIFGQRTLNLRGDAAGRLREVLACELVRRLGAPAPRTAFAAVHLSAPGQTPRRLLGLYTVVEAVDEAFFADRFGETPGALFPPDAARALPDEALGRLVRDADAETFAREIDHLVAVDDLIAYLAATTALGIPEDFRTPGRGFVLWREPGSGRYLVAPGDLSHALSGEATTVSLLPTSRANPLVARLLAVPELRRRYESALRRAAATLRRLVPTLDTLQIALRESLARERAAGLSDSSDGGIATLKLFLERRAQAIEGQLTSGAE